MGGPKEKRTASTSKVGTACEGSGVSPEILPTISPVGLSGSRSLGTQATAGLIFSSA